MFRENIPKDDQRVPAEGPNKEIHGLGATEAQLVHLNSDDVLMFRENIPKDDQRVPAEGPDEEAHRLGAAEARLLQEGQGQEVLAAGGNPILK